MTTSLATLLQTTERLLTPWTLNDYCPNGLQVEGKPEVSRIVTGVTASQALIDAAIADGADAILVHHGYFWKGEDPCVRGMKKQRLAALLAADVSLLAYHLPLDVHPQVGNNVQLARLLGLQIEGGLEPGKEQSIGLYGRLPDAITAKDLAQLIAERLDRQPLHVGDGDALVQRIGWCTGGAQGYIDKAIALRLDAFITGEISEPTTHSARENNIHFFAAGHHATERYGVQALGNHLADKLGLEHRFIDIDNPA